MSLSEAERLQRELFLRAALPGAAGQTHAQLIEALTSRQYQVGDILFLRDEPFGLVYFLVEGRVVLEAEGEPPRYFGPSGVVGVFDAILERPHARQCRAVEPTSAYELKSSVWFDVLDDDPDAARGSVRNIATQVYEQFSKLGQRTPVARALLPRGAMMGASLSLYDRILALRGTAILERAGMEAIAALAEVASEVRLSPGEDLFETGKARDFIPILVAGSIDFAPSPLGAGSQEKATRYMVSDVVGGAAALCRRLSHHTAIAIEPSIVLCIDEQEFFDRAEEHPQLARGTLAYLVTEMDRAMSLA